MIQFTYLPQLVAIAIIARKFPLTALGGSLILASDNALMTLAGFLLVAVGQYVHIQKIKKARLIKELVDDMQKQMETENKK